MFKSLISQVDATSKHSKGTKSRHVSIAIENNKYSCHDLRNLIQPRIPTKQRKSLTINFCTMVARFGGIFLFTAGNCKIAAKQYGRIYQPNMTQTNSMFSYNQILEKKNCFFPFWATTVLYHIQKHFASDITFHGI